ncbi:PhnD/SsuA/transferrin family substrate-binding protein [Candidatus Sulfurimonas marisnigri]|uniref:histidine kinase n=1 Tax=Candidatus Sulfurimonas marisnigri TaxID=2740405 RepID=A0A7S7RQ94_9BACT|nr:sensor histidine kinase [Candidatus Sulfurimonas marisnigri]QOY54225.1 PhnD/SsuA/transferrin family substrate-binding protein [Candidatus Sulfurimonas marisnigri]
MIDKRPYIKYIFLFIMLLLSTSLFAQKEIKIGIFAYNGVEFALNRWDKTIKTLDKAIPDYKISALYLTKFNEMTEVVKNSKIDFVLTNPTAYARLEKEYGISRISTLINTREDGGLTQFSSVFFTRADRDDINSLKDFKGKSIMGVNKEGFGGWQMAHKELLDNGIDPFKTSNVVFAPDSIKTTVVYSVLSGKADIGTVRTGNLEKLVSKGKIKKSDYKLIGLKNDGFALPHSTALYPEWPFATMPHTDLKVSNEMVKALLNIKTSDIAAIKGNYTGWTVPLDYVPIHNILMQLRAKPYEHYGEVTLASIWKEFKYAVVATFIIVSMIFIYTVYIGVLNKKLKISENNLKKSNRDLEKATLEIKNINQDLEERIGIAVQEYKIHKEAKQSSLKEMIGNIAHQWRQPLNILSINIQNMEFEYEDGIVNKAYLANFVHKNKHIINSMSKTINLFSEFLKNDKIKENFSVKNTIEEIISALATQFKDYKISLNLLGSDFEVYGSASEFKQVILNILNNSKDELAEKCVDNPTINITLNNGEITIDDNAGGIPDDVLDRVFEPYYTTKDQGKGMGMGLYIAKMILEESMESEILVSNTLEGARVLIKLNQKVNYGR